MSELLDIPPECAAGNHRYSPLISGFYDPDLGRAVEHIYCQDCPAKMEITEEVQAGRLARYEECVANGIRYRGVMGHYDPPGEETGLRGRLTQGR